MTGSPTALDARYRTRSLWLDGAPGSLAPRHALDGDATFDVVVVGGGFTGLWTAYYLQAADPHLRICVIEREIAGFGPSGRNGGWVSAGMAGSWSVYERSHGVEATRRAERETMHTVDEIGRVIAQEGIDCSFVKDGTIDLALSEPQEHRLRERLERARARGFDDGDLAVLTSSEVAPYLNVEGARLALYSPHCARVDPARLARGLAQACERAGVVVYERTEALEVGPRRVRCRSGTVTGEVVVRATESYTTQLGGEKLRFLPLYSLMIATEPLSDTVWSELAWREGLTVEDHHHLFFYAQRTADGRIAIGGRGAPYRFGSPITESNERSEAVRARLSAAIRRCFPAAADAAITHHWGGPLAVPRDWCTSVSYDHHTGLGWAGGYSGHGVAASNISGRTMCDLVLGRTTDLTSLPWVGHRSRRWEPEPLRYLASQAIVRVLESADRFEDRTGRTARRARLVAPFIQQP